MSSTEERVSQLEHRVFKLREGNAEVLKELKLHEKYYSSARNAIVGFDERLAEKESYKGFAWFWGILSVILVIVLFVVA